MSPPIYLRLVFAASLFSCMGLQNAMEAEPGPQKVESMNLAFSIYSTDHGQSLTATRLIVFREEPSLVESHVAGLDQSVSVHPVKQPDAKPVLTWQLQQRMGMAQWDAAAANQGALAVVSTDPGSSRSPLSFGISDQGEEIRLTQKYPVVCFKGRPS